MTPLTTPEADLADAALLAMFRLRDALVHRDANLSACRVDDMLTAMEDFARGRTIAGHLVGGLDPKLVAEWEGQ